MNYQQLWSTPIGKVQIDLPENIRKTLIQQVIFNYNRRKEAKERIPSFMDLFDYTQYVGDEKIDVFKAVYRFELIISKIIRSFVEQAWGMNEKAELAMHCTSKVQVPYDMRIEPHRHNNVDLTAVHYLTTGNEFHLDNCLGPNRLDSTLDEGPYLPNDYSGELLLLDPRPCITYPYNNKAKTIKPQNGLTVIHPGYVWHETHQHTQPGVRIALVINVEISKETKVHSSLKQLINMRTLI